MLRPDAPQAVARATGLGRVIGQTLVAQNIAVVVDARDHAAGTQLDVLHRFQFQQRAADPFRGGQAIDLDPIHRGAPAPMGGLLHQQDLGTGAARQQRGLKARDAAARNHQIGMGVEMLVFVRVAGFGIGGATKARGFADHRLEHMLPGGAREQEGLVVEPRRKKARDEPVDLAHVELQRGPVVLRGGRQIVEQLGGRGALVRLMAVARAKVDQRIRLLRAAGHDAARPVVLERAPHQRLTVGQQGRGQRVAAMALHGLAVEGEGNPRGAVDQTTLRFKTSAHCA
mmetsp:Transcript_3643/g.6704  ORF Transcript_3643/g.6704 Transcript_3643/m.6704 type:complete len:285 (+) Transcript_3643:564-1418(+)